MTELLYYTVFPTDAGWVGLLASDAGLRYLELPLPTKEETRRMLPEDAAENPAPFKGLMERLRAYFSGQPASFPDMLDLSTATPFQRRVWQAARMIPYGETRTYGWLAGQIGRPGAARAVGQAIGRNPVPIVIPCHRVLGSSGLGGFYGGLDLKRSLLRLEGHRV
jgi:methylated-DNA-[protein]-cysteine S-methyltransferase